MPDSSLRVALRSSVRNNTGVEAAKDALDPAKVRAQPRGRIGSFRRTNLSLSFTKHTMKSIVKRIFLSAVGALLVGCGSVHHAVVKPAGDLSTAKGFSVGKIEVSSRETNPDALNLNQKLQAKAQEEINALLTRKKIVASNTPDGNKIEMKIDVVYGNQAIRWVGGLFGAGKGSIKVMLEAKDAAGSVLYSSVARADLSVAAFGGSMVPVAEDTITTAVKKLEEQL